MEKEQVLLQELQASQTHLCAGQDHGADPPGNNAKAHGEQRGG